MEARVVIVGAGPSGLATSACLSAYSVPHIILEREDSYASLWKNRCYDRVKLHIAKEFCELPFMSHASDTPIFMPRETFLRYLEDYVARFHINPAYNRRVEMASYDESAGRWKVEARNTVTNEKEVYVSEFLVVASGENDEGYIPEVEGLGGFGGEVVHSSEFKSGLKYRGKKVLVVGCGNSGMEIGYDLSNFGAQTAIVVRYPLHVLTKEMVYLGMLLLKYHLPVSVVDACLKTLSRLLYGDLSKYGFPRPSGGPFYTKIRTGKSPILDVGTIAKIRAGEIQVVPAGIVKIDGKRVLFENGLEQEFDVIVFATGYKSMAAKWLKDYQCVLTKDGFPRKPFPDHWKGDNGAYCVGFSRRALAGVTADAKAVAEEINRVLTCRKHKIMPYN